MITTDNYITRVRFGNSDKAKIRIQLIKNTITFKELNALKQIGDKVLDGESKDLPQVELHFYTAESIDALTAALDILRKQFHESIPYAV